MVESSAQFQDAFHGGLTAYINGGLCTPIDLYLAVLNPRRVLRRNAKLIIRKYELLANEIAAGNAAKLHFRVEPYKGQNRHIRKMMSFLSEHLNDDLFGAYIHGSLATGEEIAYSDFDVLAILKNSVFDSTAKLVATARKLKYSRKIMLDFDPIQHHGWFVLTELDLWSYCDSYFPVELFNHSKSLFEDNGLELNISLRDSGSETRRAFEKMADTIITKVENRQHPTNIYQLKLLLSQFMLLPALYLQARDGRGVYKKESFAIARNDFDASDWAIMDAVSQIRADWSYEISALRKRLMCSPHVLSRYFTKRFAPAIPEKMRRVLTGEFYGKMAVLARRMKGMLA